MNKINKILDLVFNKKISSVIIRIWILLLIVFTVYKGYILGWSEYMLVGEGAWSLRKYYANKGLYSLQYLNIFSIMMASAIIVLPLTLWFLFFKSRQLFKNPLITYFSYSLLICMSIYTFIRIDTPLNYYASRYFLPVLIPVLIILFILIISKLNLKFVIIPLIIIICLFNFTYNIILMQNPIFEGSFNLFNEIMEEAPKKSYIFLNTDSYSRKLLTLNLKYLGDFNVIYIGNGKSLNQIKNKINLYLEELKLEECYLLSTSLSGLNKYYKKIDFTFHVFPQQILYPTKNILLSKNYFLYKLDRKKITNLKINEETFYDIGNEDGIFVDNMYEAENNKFRWTKNKSYVNLYYYKKNNIKLIIKMVGPRPKNNPASVTIYFNDEKIDSFIKESGDLEYTIYIPKDLIKDGEVQKLRIESNTWNPSNYGYNDRRNLGVAIDWLKIEEV
ncbi:MAG: hypothetical protein JG764_1619 [Clostridiales bacterium]|jgi:hypothetical protein|nr:hypothetical protein [Clostridiales bacterium]